jgi:predicted secreted acid phosphatase
MTDSQQKIADVCDEMKNVLMYKNEKYGDSALHPNNVFYKGDSTNSIKIRLDDKIGRVKNCKETRINDVADIIGYSVLLLVSMGATVEDFEKLKD